MKILFTLYILVCAVLCHVTCEDEDESHYKHLCDGSEDRMECVRDYFERNAECSVIRGEMDDKPMVLTKVRNTYAPVSNLSIVLHDCYFARLNGTMEAFYINEKNNELVMSVHFNNLHIDAKDGTFVISRRSKEPKKVKSWAYASYVVVLTAVIPLDGTEKISADTIENSMITPYFPRSYLEFVVGPGISESDDPLVAAVSKSVEENISAVIDELYLTGSYLFFEAFLEKHICNFGFPFKKAE